MSNPPAVNLNDLRAALDAHGPGEITDPGIFIGLLAQVWDDMVAGETAMYWHKLARLESPQWHPPVLSFQVERHGAAVMGSKNAEVQHWEVDTDAGTAVIVHSTGRRITEYQHRWNAAEAASDLLRAVQAGSDDDRLKWSPDRAKAKIITSVILPAGVKQTTDGRRKRFYNALSEQAREHGIEVSGSYISKLEAVDE